MSITSPSFKDETKFPVFQYPDGIGEHLVDKMYTRINEKFVDGPMDQTAPPHDNPLLPPRRDMFWFRLSDKFLYYGETKDCINTLGTLNYRTEVDSATISAKNEKCFEVAEKSGSVWEYCGITFEDSKKFVCAIQKNLRKKLDERCIAKPIPKTDDTQNKPESEIEEKIITQPYILIPLAREMCNENWTYKNHGKEWQCLCKEGKH